MPPLRPTYRFLSSPYAGRRKGAGNVGLKNAPRPTISSWLRRLVQTQSLPASLPRHEKVNDIRAYSGIIDVHIVDNMLNVEMEESTDAGTPTAQSEYGGDTEVEESDGQSDSSMGSSNTSKAADWCPPERMIAIIAQANEQPSDAETVPTERDSDSRSPSPDRDSASDSDDSRGRTPFPAYVRSPSPEAVVPPDVANPDQFNDIMRHAPGGGRARANYFRKEYLRSHPSLAKTEPDDSAHN